MQLKDWIEASFILTEDSAQNKQLDPKKPSNLTILHVLWFLPGFTRLDSLLSSKTTKPVMQCNNQWNALLVKNGWF